MPSARRQYADPLDRRFHAQPWRAPIAGRTTTGAFREYRRMASNRRLQLLLESGQIVAIKGIGGYHLACDARNAPLSRSMRERKYRKEKPFAVMVRDHGCRARTRASFREAKRCSPPSPAPSCWRRPRWNFRGVAPDNSELGCCCLTLRCITCSSPPGAPEALVMTSANRSSEPIAYQDDEARRAICGNRRCLPDRRTAYRAPRGRSVARAGAFGPMILRRSRG